MEFGLKMEVSKLLIFIEETFSHRARHLEPSEIYNFETDQLDIRYKLELENKFWEISLTDYRFSRFYA